MGRALPPRCNSTNACISGHRKNHSKQPQKATILHYGCAQVIDSSSACLCGSGKCIDVSVSLLWQRVRAVMLCIALSPGGLSERG